MTGSPRLAELTTLRVGGAPQRYLAPADAAELVATTRGLWADDEPTVILGGGSNTLAADGGVDATLVHVVTRGVERLDSSDGWIHLRVQAGEPWDEIVHMAVQNGWGGIEALSGIPGSTGAVPVQNVGAYGQEVASALVSVDVLERSSLAVRRIPSAELGLGYRTSIFKTGFEGLILAVELKLAPAASESGVGRAALGVPIAYAQLASALGVETGARVGLQDARDAVLALRASKGMVLDAGDPDTASAGSFFTNPIVTQSFAHGLPTDAPRFGLGAEQPADGPLLVKLSAAWLIERAGIARGFALPGSGAAVSGKHTLALTNRGTATAADIRELAEFIRLRVASDFGVQLRAEPVLLGFDEPEMLG